MKAPQKWMQMVGMALVVLMFSTGCSDYEEGPKLSFRSKVNRMQFTRPITRYEVNGVDSTDWLTQTIADTFPEFDGKVQFLYEPSEDDYPVYIPSSKRRIGLWLPNAEWDYLYFRFSYVPYGPGGWEIIRLSSTNLILRRISNGTQVIMEFSEP